MISQADEARLARLIRAVVREELDAREASSAAPSTSEPAPKLLSLKEAAARLGVSDTTARGLVRDGRLVPIRISGNRGRMSFRVEDINALLRLP
ncbi:MAG: helix-turn-helix domain-containing protein [Myxococcota bacterium]|jgi:excisionase family DNA binding protein|nr:helix-turn-helix domain-containing protein [Myxococcota bacterium]